MSQRHIFVDKTELVLVILLKSKVQNVNLSYADITRIQFEPCKEFHWFRFVKSEKIQIVTSKRAVPIEYTRCKEKKYFDTYKKELSEFAVRNRVSFVNNSY